MGENMAPEFKVKVPATADVPGDLIIKLNFTPPPIIPWDWVKRVIEAILKVWYYGAEITWEGTTATIVVRNWHEKEFKTKEVAEKAMEVKRQMQELME